MKAGYPLGRSISEINNRPLIERKATPNGTDSAEGTVVPRKGRTVVTRSRKL